jgi:hypothetical protein
MKRLVECTKCPIAKGWCFEGIRPTEIPEHQETEDCPLIKLAMGEIKVECSGYIKI